MITVKDTDVYRKWFRKLKDYQAKAKIEACILRLKAGNFGDTEPVGSSVSELRIHYGPGYRVYYGQEGDEIVLLINGGTKKTQQADIKQAVKMWKELKK